MRKNIFDTNFDKLIHPITTFYNSLKGRVVIFSLPGVVIGCIIGMRAFESGAIPKSMLIGSTVYITGTCQINGKDRVPAFSRDQITITNRTNDYFTGVLIKTREHVECIPSKAVLDPLPYFSDVLSNPLKAPDLGPAIVENKINEAQSDLLDKKLTVTGTCTRQDGSQESLSDDVVVFKTSAQLDNKTILSGIIITEGKKRGTLVSCDKLTINTELFVEVVVDDKTVINKGERDLRGETVLVTSTCFPDDKFENKEGKKEQLYYTFNDSPVKVMSYKKDGSGEVIYLRGISLEKKKAIVCDKKNYEIAVRLMTNEMKLIPINSNTESDSNINNNQKK